MKDAEVKQQKLFSYASVAFGSLMILLLIFGYRNIRLKRIAENKIAEFEKEQRVLQERTRIASELHDDLGSGLTKISLMSQVAGTIAGDKQQQALNKISAESSDMVDKMNGIIWALNTKNDTLPNLISFIRKHAFEMFEDSQIQLTWDAPEAIEEIPVSGEARRNIYLVVKEALHNTLKYSLSDSVKVKVKVKVKEDALEITIEDNGKGFDVAIMKGKGNGLANMKKRIDDMKGDFKITSELNKGTLVIFSYPINSYTKV